jgi:hypothetical protein
MHPDPVHICCNLHGRLTAVVCVSALANSQPASGQLSSQCPHDTVILGATINLREPFKHTHHNMFSVMFPWCDNTTIDSISQ